MNPSFNIQPANTDTSNAHLYVEAGATALSMVVLNDQRCFEAVVVYPFPADLPAAEYEEELHHILSREPLLQQQYRKTVINWTFAESIIVPNEWMNKVDNGNLLNLVYGDLETAVVKADFLFRHNLHHIYRVPQPVHYHLSNKLLYAAQSHQYTLLPDIISTGGDRLLAIFYNNRVTVLASKNGALQAMQQYCYHNADDAAYHILSVCAAFDMKQDEVILELSGMIDLDSHLYAGLYKYFLNVECFPLPDGFTYTEAIRAYPDHFFSHLFATAACV